MRRTDPGNVRPTEFELELLQLLWAKDGATVRELYETLKEHRELGYTTVLKTIQIMLEKALVTREEVGNAHLYRAARSEQQTQRQFVGDLSTRLFGGSAARLALHALSTGVVDDQELAAIKKLIAQKEGRA